MSPHWSLGLKQAMSEDKVARRDFPRGTLAAGAGVLGGTLLACKSASSEDAAQTQSTQIRQAPAVD